MRRAVETLHECDRLRIKSIDFSGKRRNDRVLVSWTGVGHAMGAVNVQRKEFASVGAQYDRALFVTDLKRSWGNNLPLDVIKAHLPSQKDGAEVSAIGNSMGGFLAIAFSKLLSFRRVFSVVPQFSVHPDVVPWERRWKHYLSSISDWQICSLENAFSPECDYFVVTSQSGPDARHAKLMGEKPTLTRITIGLDGHDVGKRLKELGLLKNLVSDCLSGAYDPNEFRLAFSAAVARFEKAKRG